MGEFIVEPTTHILRYVCDGKWVRRRRWLRVHAVLSSILSTIILIFALGSLHAAPIPEPPWGFMAPLEMGRDFLSDDPAADASVVFDKGDIIVGPGFNFSLLRRCPASRELVVGATRVTAPIAIRSSTPTTRTSTSSSLATPPT